MSTCTHHCKEKMVVVAVLLHLRLPLLLCPLLQGEGGTGDDAAPMAAIAAMLTAVKRKMEEVEVEVEVEEVVMVVVVAALVLLLWLLLPLCLLL